MKKILTLTAPFVILIGTFLWALGSGNTILTQGTLNYGTFTWTYYKFDLYKYIENIQNVLNSGDNLGNLVINLPQLPENPANNWDILKYLKYVVNILLVYLTNWIVYLANLLLLTPIKLVIYYPAMLLALIGINSSANGVLYAFNWLLHINIPYIPYM